MTAASAVKQHQEIEAFDPTMIDSLSGIMSAQAIQSLVLDMAQDVRTRLKRIAETQVAQGSLNMIRHDAHDLKSMGGNFGLTGLAEQAGVVERAARDGCVKSVKAAIPSLMSTGQWSLKALAERHESSGGRTS
jgi:chemotaxis protein histidine kinase CheA